MSWQSWFAQMERNGNTKQKQQIKEARSKGISDLETAYALYEWACPSFKEIWKSRPKGASKMEQGEAVVFLYQWITGQICDGSKRIDGPDSDTILFKVLQRSMAEGMKASHITYVSKKKTPEDAATNAIREAFRKNRKLNGDEKYVAMSPGERKDKQLKSLRKLAVKFKGSDKIGEIQKYIKARENEIRGNKDVQEIISLINKIISDVFDK